MEAKNGRKAHVLAVAGPAQGHVKPLMKLCRQIAKHGLKVTLVNLQSVHDKLVGEEDNIVQMVSIPDVPIEEDKDDPFKKMKNLRKTMPESLKDLIQGINSSSNPEEKIGFVIADVMVEWLMDTAAEMGAEPILFSPTSAAFRAMMSRIPALLEDGMLDLNGNIEKCEKITLSDDIPAWDKDEFSWSFPHDPKTQKSFFDLINPDRGKIIQPKLHLINTCYELESPACDLRPNLLPVGPLLEMNNSCNFYPEDESCLSWLDTKLPESVIYVSFGSIAVVSQQQLDELALGLELSGRAFLWVVRPDLVNGLRAVYPDGFLERVSGIGMIVEWAPQERVLFHPSVACFLTHCGWNSILEGLSKGVSFLCWPFFMDQFHNQNYICDKWEAGLRVDGDGSGIRTRNEIKEKIGMMFCNGDLKANAMRLKEIFAKTVCEGGSSYNNFERFIDYLRK
uniref:UDP-glucosyltransferase n=1 Tax=Lamium galeobdolon TaxID=53161 RepID=F8R895_LAMGA|nr:UDP-glucosyltransferase [Lamium galeobdolon]